MRETVFKVQSASDKVMCSRNAPRSCIHCLIESPPGSPDFPVCSGCRGVRYCVRPELTLRPRLTKKKQSREHQAADWPLHKAFCKQQRINNEHLESHVSQSGLPPLTYRRRLLEDFVGIHRRSIAQGMVSALHVADRPFDFSEQHAMFSFSYNPESDDNPSMAFELKWVVFLDNPPGSGRMAATLEASRPLRDYRDREDRGKPGYLGCLACVCGCFFIVVGYIATDKL